MDLPHIYLPAEKEGSYPKGLGTPRGKATHLKYNEEILAENYSKGLKELIEAGKNETLFIYLKLNKCDVWSSRVKKLLSNLNLELVRIYTKQFLIVKCSPNNLKTLSKKFEAKHEYIKEAITEFGIWSDFNKIFSELKEKVQNKEDKEKFQVVLSTFENVSEDERTKLRNNLEKEFLSDKIEYYFNEDFKTYHCDLSSKEILKYSKESFIENIRPPTRFVTSETQEGRYAKNSEVHIAEVTQEELGSICILDSGISKFDKNAEKVIVRKTIFQDSGEDNAPNGGHGTQVASLAMFGQDIAESELFLKPKSKIISHKIVGANQGKNSEADLLLVLKEVIDESISETRIFNMSVNTYAGDIPLTSFENLEDYFILTDLANKIDRFIKEKNIVFVNSVGNIIPPVIEKQKQDYPKYLAQNHVFFPSFAREVVSVGAYFLDGQLCSYTRIGTPYETRHFGCEKKNFISPTLLAFGGDNSFLGEASALCINNLGEIKENYGTSFAAPLVSLAFRILEDKNSDLKNTETLKAILLNSCKRKTITNKEFFLLPTLRNMGVCEDNVYFNFEGNLKPIYPNYKKKEKIIHFARFKFFVPRGADELDFVLVHSSKHPFESCDEILFRPLIEVKRAGGGVIKNNKLDGNLDCYERIHHAKYNFERAGDNFWTITVSFEHKSPIPEIAKNVSIRFGLSARISFRDKSKDFLKKAYQLILEQHHLQLESVKQKTIYTLVASQAKDN